jgi:hypothetical protein
LCVHHINYIFAPTKIKWRIRPLVKPSDVVGSMFALIKLHHVPFCHMEHLLIYAQPQLRREVEEAKGLSLGHRLFIIHIFF